MLVTAKPDLQRLACVLGRPCIMTIAFVQGAEMSTCEGIAIVVIVQALHPSLC